MRMHGFRGRVKLDDSLEASRLNTGDNARYAKTPASNTPALFLLFTSVFLLLFFLLSLLFLSRSLSLS